MSEKSATPVYREYTFSVQDAPPVSEAINLLSQSMGQFKDLSPQEVDSIAHWFFKNYATTKDIS